MLKPEFQEIIDKLQYYEEIFDFLEYNEDYIIVTELKVVRVSKDALVKWIQEFHSDIIWEYQFKGDTIHITEFGGKVSYTIDLNDGNIIKWE